MRWRSTGVLGEVVLIAYLERRRLAFGARKEVLVGGTYRRTGPCRRSGFSLSSSGSGLRSLPVRLRLPSMEADFEGGGGVGGAILGCKPIDWIRTVLSIS